MRKLKRLFLLLILATGVGLLWLYLERVEPPAPINVPIVGQVDRIIIEKSARKMTLYQNEKPVREYAIALGFAPDGDKWKQGDGKTPEGVFKINRRNQNSKYTLSLGIDYPKPEDITRARNGGYDPGGDIFIHGQPNKVAEGFKVKGDWTAGCIAVTNPEIREIWNVTPMGTIVEIRR
ncbi:hypothetical protein BFP76_09530 [Amylibacter kogurei]|uniref:L,D-TPase catalytic domain-containing protein n=2 Tax=Paramylibacter kogurei TaxID=1889778 RepID=A0A2G5K183_9RHOB|nr:L,D-transpeptidase family protein [Amylibacter kogurei]PIB23306.1 hypothetical protein BFP76_09530 [Amylibacter kogurei]